MRSAKSEWIVKKCNIVNNLFHGTVCSKSPWDTVKLLKSGLAPLRRASPPKLIRLDGSIATTPEEVAYVFLSFFSTLYGRSPTFELSVLDLLMQESCFLDLDAAPIDNKIIESVNKLNTSSSFASRIHARLWQALSSPDTGFDFILHFVIQFWLTKKPHVEWEIYLLSILPKKGDMSNLGNYRGIIMLEVAYKNVANIILTRPKPI